MKPPGRGVKFPLRLDQLAPVPRSLVPPPAGSAPTTAAPPPTAPAAPATRALLRPQSAVHHSAGNARRLHAPSGLGLDSADVRRRMAERLRAQGLRHEAVLAALAAVPRHLFVDPALVTQAYEDTSLPIGHGQTISKPSVVARMLEVLFDGANARAAGHLGRVLEVGSGCGYQAALLCQLAPSVLSIERVRALHERARERTRGLRLRGLRLLHGDGMLGHPAGAPYDSIIAAASGDALPPAWLAQLAVGGRLVAPLVEATAGGAARQVLVVVDRHAQGYTQVAHEAVQFVPLKSGSV